MAKILIIEDDKSIAELERDYLEANGYSAEIEPSGDKGYFRALNENFSLVILDIMLKGDMDGFAVCSKLREKKDIPIIMLSAKKEDVDKIRGLGLGADDYMTKPFSPQELVARVNAHLSRYDRLVGTKTGDTIEIGGLFIDKVARRVFVDEEEKVLTLKEYELLAFLAENPNKVYSKDELFRQIWEMDAFGDIATVTVHIKKIREKLGDNSTSPRFIETIWGVGYRFKM